MDHDHAVQASAVLLHLAALKAEIAATWPMTSLLDVVKEADLRLGFTNALKSSTSYESLDRAILQPRLLLCLHGIGTNTGLLHGRVAIRRHLQRPCLCTEPVHHCRGVARGHCHPYQRQPCRARDPAIWGEGMTACASDSKHFGAWIRT